MKTWSAALIRLLILLGPCFLAGQAGVSPNSIESRQGHHPDGPDVIGHAHILKGAKLECIQVEVYDETHQASTSCVVRFEDGADHTLAFGQSMQSPQEGRMWLECSGNLPRRCKVRYD